MPKTHFQHELEGMVCQCGGEDCDNSTIVLRSNCHPNTHTWTFYDKTDHLLKIVCAECEEIVTCIEVAKAN